MSILNLHNAEFIKSAAKKDGFIRDSMPKIVFSGKSNVGKSSVINRILNRKNFARVGATPGKTVHVNYFKIDNKCYFIDLPGYGFANVPKAERDRWGALMERFFEEPDNITLGVMIVDARHKPTGDDVTMARWFIDSGRPFIVLPNKMDKLKKSEIESNMAAIRETLGIDEYTMLLPFSAETGMGRNILIGEIERAISG